MDGTPRVGGTRGTVLRFRLDAVGTERVEVPAGTFDTCHLHPMTPPRSDRPMLLRALRRTAATVLLPLAAAAQPGPAADPELAALHAQPQSAWRAFIRTDTLGMEGIALTGAAVPAYWTRARYATPRRYAGNLYDTRYTRYEADCTGFHTRITRMVWTRDPEGTVADTSFTRPPADAAPGTIARALLDLACAGRAAPDLAAVMALPPARWTKLETSDPAGGDRFADYDGAVREEGVLRVWLLARMAEPRRIDLGTFDRQYQRWDLDCPARRTRLYRLAVAHGEQVLGDSVLPQPWVEPNAGTVAHQMLTRLCPRAAAPAHPAPALAARSRRGRR